MLEDYRQVKVRLWTATPPFLRVVTVVDVPAEFTDEQVRSKLKAHLGERRPAPAQIMWRALFG